jgi:hypothetical protein
MAYQHKPLRFMKTDLLNSPTDGNIPVKGTYTAAARFSGSSSLFRNGYGSTCTILEQKYILLHDYYFYLYYK